ncbi:sigma factor-like helix-turn-helix DNA-binding protein [Nonomuraea sp. NPDC049646]|uniref:sigma factor-like helix-turn-helix DNA-binding protein n=1 Tax=unclassified Nonomuraea TaxID=2593643 RepID=UPI0037947B58
MAAPELGEHTDEVPADLLSPSPPEQASLRTDGVVVIRPRLFEVVVNAAISRARRRRVVQEIMFARPPETAADSPDLDLRDALIGELRRLPPRMRAVLVLRYWEDQSEQATATLLGCSVGTVKSQAARGLARIRQNMDVAREVTR